MTPDRSRTASHRDKRADAAPEWTAARIVEVVVMVLMLVVGGSSNQTPPARMAAELLGLVLLAGPLVHARWRAVAGADRVLTGLVLALLALLALQCVPLAPALWSAMPGHAPYVAGDVLLFGHAIARPLSLDTQETLASALFLVPAFALWLRLRTDAAFGERAIIGFLVFLLVSLLLAAAQSGGAPGEYHLYINTHAMVPTGVFANRNHQAVAMDCGVVLAAILESRWRRTDRHAALRGWLFAAGALLFSTGSLLTGSRAGAALLVPALLAGALIARGTGRQGRIALLACLAVIGLGVGMVMFHAGGQLGAIGNRGFLVEDDRYLYWPIAVRMIGQYWPWGTGFGTFPHAYEVVEPRTMLSPLWLNHVHNDWLEYLLEAGLPGALLAAAFLIWLAVRLVGARRAGIGAPTILGAGMVVLLLLAHSAYDYPLRTVALSSLFALMLGLLVPAPALAGPAAAAAPRLRRGAVGLGLAVIAAAVIAQTMGFNAAQSPAPLLGVSVPLANTRAKARGALELAAAHRNAARADVLALQGATQSPLAEPEFTALALTTTDPARADLLFEQAHRLSRRDPVLLSALLERARTRHDPQDELSAFDEIARLQKETPAQDVEFARDLSDPRLRALVVASLAQAPRWRGHFLEGASGDRAGLANLVPLMHDLATAANPPSREDLVPLISHLLNGQLRDPPKAWQLWRDLSPGSDPLDWDMPTGERIAMPFDWVLAGQTTAGDHGTIQFDNGDGNTPVIASKYIVLPVGNYRFDATGDIQGIVLQRECEGSRSTAAPGELVSIPANCPFARIGIKVPARTGVLRTVRLTPVGGTAVARP